MMIPTKVWLGCGVWAIRVTSLVVTAAVVLLLGCKRLNQTLQAGHFCVKPFQFSAKVVSTNRRTRWHGDLCDFISELR